MSAPQIPNLLSSRGGGHSRGRGRGRGNGLRDPGAPSSSSSKDNAIQATDTDAAVSRLSAVNLGYLKDPFARFFVTGDGTRRLPIINRGTYTRTTALDLLISGFLASHSKTSDSNPLKQIISLGAGTDTRYFRLRDQNQYHNLIYHEFDFPSVCEAKRRIVASETQELINNQWIFTLPASPSSQAQDSSDATDTSPQTWGLSSHTSPDREKYICHPLDLRALPSLSNIPALRTDIPTLIISECCLCYHSVENAENILEWFGEGMSDLGVIIYEPVGTDDAFGQMMVENLVARGIFMPTVQRYKTLGDQKGRLVGLGFGEEKGDGVGKGGGVEAMSVERIWEEWIGMKEKQRVDGLEGLDEVEEWLLLARHYAVVWGWKGQVKFEGIPPPVYSQDSG